MIRRAGAFLFSTAMGAAIATPAVAETAAGTTVTNDFEVTYTVGGTTTTTDTTDAGNTGASFVVDRKIDLTVVNNDAGNEVSFQPGDTDVVATFTLTNESNDTSDFQLTVIDATTPPDDGDMTNYRIYLEDGTTAGFQSGEDTILPTDSGNYYVDELVADDGVDTDHVVTLYVLADDNSEFTANGEQAQITLLATARMTLSSGVRTATVGSLGDAITPDTVNVMSTIETIFADDGDDTTDYNGDASDDVAYTLSSAELTLTKSQTIVSDPLGSASPMSIPGAVVEYCLSVANGGSASATSVSFSDALPTTLTAITSGGDFVFAQDTDCDTGTGSPVSLTAASDAPTDDASIIESGGIWTVSITGMTIPASETRTIIFRATID